jgi:hypothetical protein
MLNQIIKGPITYDPTREIWVPCYDATDKDPDLTVADFDEIVERCVTYDAAAALSVDIEGIGGGAVKAGQQAMLIDFMATRGKRDANGVGKKYGFSIRVVVNITSIEGEVHSNITGFVAKAEAGKTSASIMVHALGVAGEAVQPTPSLSKLDIGEYAQLYAYKSKIESLLKLSGNAGVKLNAVLLERTMEKPEAPSQQELMLDSYRLLTVRGIQDGWTQQDWVKYITEKGTMKIKDVPLFTATAASVYGMFGIAAGAKPNKSQTALALEWTDGVSASRQGYS